MACRGEHVKSGMQYPSNPPSLRLAVEFTHLAISTTRREKMVLRYFFMQLGTTKSWADSKAMIKHLEAGTCMIAVDEETFR